MIPDKKVAIGPIQTVSVYNVTCFREKNGLTMIMMNNEHP